MSQSIAASGANRVVGDEPTLIDMSSISSTGETCDFVDGTASINPSGGNAPYSYEWNDPFEQITATATGLIAGSYAVVVTDGNSCTTSNTISDNNSAS